MTDCIKGFLETSFLDWPGRLAAVVFLPGCNFRCPFCHNHDLVAGGKHIPDIPLETVMERLEDLRGWVEAVVVSGGEPTVHQGLADLLRAFRSEGLRVKLDTNGSRPGVLSRLIAQGLVQAVDMDLKAPLRGDCYDRLAGVPVDLAAIRSSVEIIRSSGLPHRFRTTCIPGLLGDGEIRELARFVAPGSDYVLQPFDPRRTLDPDLGKMPPPEEEEMRRLRSMAGAATA